MVGILHFTLQFLTCLTDVLFNLLSLLLLHLIQRLPALRVLKLKRPTVGKAGWLFSFSVRTPINQSSEGEKLL